MPILAQPACRSIRPASRARTAAAKTSSAPRHMEMMYDSTTSGPKTSRARLTVRNTPRVFSPASSTGAGVGASGLLLREFLGEELGAVLAGHVGVAPGFLAEPVEQLAEGVVVGVGVFADVHGGELEAEGGEGADGAGQAAVGEESAAVFAQGGLDDPQVGDEFAGAEVVAAGLVGVPLARRSLVFSSFWRMQVALSR